MTPSSAKTDDPASCISAKGDYAGNRHFNEPLPRHHHTQHRSTCPETAMSSSSSNAHPPKFMSVGVPRQHSKTHNGLPDTRQPTSTNPPGCKLYRRNFLRSPASPLKLLCTPLLQTGRRIRGNCRIKVCVNLIEDRHTILQLDTHADTTGIDGSLPAFRSRSCSWGSIRLTSPYPLRRSTSTGSANKRPMHSGGGHEIIGESESISCPSIQYRKPDPLSNSLRNS